MTRMTSAEAYDAIKRNGLLSKARFMVYEAVYANRGLTAGELARSLSYFKNNVSTRLSELRDRGVIKEMGQRKCTITGMTVIVWEVTNRLPVEPTKIERTKCARCNGKGWASIAKVELEGPKEKPKEPTLLEKFWGIQ